MIAKAIGAGIRLLAIGAHEAIATPWFADPFSLDTGSEPLSILLRLPWPAEPSRETNLADSERRLWEAAARRCREFVGPTGHLLLIIDWGARSDPPESSVLETGRELGHDFGSSAWGVRYTRPLRRSESWKPVRAAGGTLIEIPYNLLLHPANDLLSGSGGETGVAVLASDVFAEGVLDGTRLGLASSPSSPSGRPEELSRLQERYRPVLRLGFLTAGKRRTLAQAALRFALAPPAVVSALVPIPTGPPIEEVARPESIPEFSEAEWLTFSRIG